jgi:hypothetical protein
MRLGLAPLSIALALGALVAAASWWRGGAGALPRAGRSSALDPVAENARCEGCHQAIAAEWRGSQHKTAFTDPTFQAALEIEPKAFCRGCHAPEDPDASHPDGAHTLGIGCVTCHLQGDVVISADHDGVSAASHRVARSAAFGSADACAGCHQFPFDDVERRATPLDMQRTIDEHEASLDSMQTCADCHMPRAAEGHRSHAFASTRSQKDLEKAIVAVASRTSPTGVSISLVSDGVGHAFPTGDLFRRLAVRAEVTGPDNRVLTGATRYLARHFATGRDRFDAPIREELYDNRVKPGETSTIELDLGPSAQGMPVRWFVRLERVLHVADNQEASAILSDSVRLAEGELLP